MAVALFGDDLTCIFRHQHGVALYSRGAGRIADGGEKLTALGNMPEELAAKRIIALATNPGREWKPISFNGSDRFIELAMRTVLVHKMKIHAHGQAQQEIRGRLMAEAHGGGMMAAGGPPCGAIQSRECWPNSTFPRLAAIRFHALAATPWMHHRRSRP
jgi:hypothetical protein